MHLNEDEARAVLCSLTEIGKIIFKDDAEKDLWIKQGIALSCGSVAYLNWYASLSAEGKSIEEIWEKFINARGDKPYIDLLKTAPPKTIGVLWKLVWSNEGISVEPGTEIEAAALYLEGINIAKRDTSRGQTFVINENLALLECTLLKCVEKVAQVYLWEDSNGPFWMLIKQSDPDLNPDNIYDQFRDDPDGLKRFDEYFESYLRAWITHHPDQVLVDLLEEAFRRWRI